MMVVRALRISIHTINMNNMYEAYFAGVVYMVWTDGKY